MKRLTRALEQDRDDRLPGVASRWQQRRPVVGSASRYPDDDAVIGDGDG